LLLVASRIQDKQEEYKVEIIKHFGLIRNVHERPGPSQNGPWDPYTVGGDQQLICLVFAHHSMTYNNGHTSDGSGVAAILRLSLDYTLKIFLNAYDMHVGNGLIFTKTGKVGYQSAIAGLRITFVLFLHFNGIEKYKNNMFVVTANVPLAGLDHNTISTNLLYSDTFSTYCTPDKACGLFAQPP
jgi:hypothetical protein